MANTYLLEVVTPEEELFSEQVYSLRAPAYEGSLGVLPGHAPMLASLQPGILQIKKHEEDQPMFISISGGFLEVSPERTVILADSAVLPEQIDLEAARDDYIRTFKKLYSTEEDFEGNREKAEKELQKARKKLETAQKAGRDVTIPDVMKG